MKKLVKRLFALGFVLVLVLIGAVVLGVMNINSLAKAGIEKGGTYALGTNTTLQSANVGLLSGTFSMNGLNVANPPGYKSASFLSLGSGGVAVSFNTLSKPVVELPKLSLDGLNVALEKSGGTANFNVILDHIKKVAKQAGGSGGSGGSSSGGDKKFVVNELSLTNIKISVDLIGGPGDLTKVNIPIDEIKLNNVGKTGTGVGGTGVTMSQLASIIVEAVLAAAADKGGGILPADILGDLQGGLAGLGNLDNLQMSVAAKAQGTIEKIGGDAVKKVTEKLGGEAGKVVEDATKKVTDLIPGMKKPEKK
ncbi:MAG: hypothetical protein K2Y21_05895 [Phycisphaerales bacterium]|nr:hypothetical protein [Phycisphaerales bacterium]